VGNEVLIGDVTESAVPDEPVVDETTEGDAEEATPEVPEKFRGKSLADVVDSYKNLERELGRKGQEIGELRRLTDQLLLDSRAREKTTQKEPEVDFFDDPKAAVKKLLQEELNPLRAKLATSEQSTTVAQLEKAHPGWKDIVANEDFQQWIAASKVRKRLYAEADSYNFDSADELLSTWKTLRQVEDTKKAVEKEEKKRVSDLKKASSETGRTGESSKKVYRRADLIRLKMSDPSRYAELQDEIMAAYQEGRIR